MELVRNLPDLEILQFQIHQTLEFHYHCSLEPTKGKIDDIKKKLMEREIREK